MQSGQTAMTQSQAPQMTTQKKSLFDFLSMAGSQKCTFSDKSDGSSGAVYVSSGKMRGDFQRPENGKTNASHMINDGKYMYYWSDGEKSGYKMSLDFVKQQAAQITTTPDNNISSSNEQTPSQAVNMKQQADYSCGGWSEDASMFTVPTDITFTDYSTMMQGAMHGITPPAGAAGAGMTSQQKSSECAQCDQVPAGAMRNQCKAALKC